MTPENLREFYSQRQRLFETRLLKINQQINLVSNVRVGAALAFLILAYFGLKQHDLFYALLPVLILFIVLVRKHARLYEEKKHLENLMLVQKYERHTLDGDYSHNSSGSEFIDINHPYTHDLDIFGEGSLFQYVNRSNTRGGKKLMAERLSSKPESEENIVRWQEAGRELAFKTDFRHEVQALSMQTDEQPKDEEQLKQWLRDPSFVFGKPLYRTLLIASPAITVGLITLAFFIDGLTSFAVLAAALQWVFLGFHLKRVNAFHQYISRKKSMLQNYAKILYFVRKEEYTSPLLQMLRTRASEADEKVRQLAGLVSTFDARLNSMTNLFVNALLLFDLQCVYRLEKWKTDNASRLPEWIEIVREMEVLCSFGTFSFNHPGFAFPQVNSEQQLDAKGMGHPLLDEQERVVNDVHLDALHSIMIITGANMAGKSTFLRSLGVNFALAMAGAPVCAEAFNCPLVELRSGMRTADSLKENQSYFYAELDRLKSIMDELRQGKTLLILLDEILKGTNSTDKQAGSIALVQQLTKQSCLVLIATHDLALGELEKAYAGKVGNYSFEANIQDDQLSFDYKLKRGIAQKMNATFLMKTMGIIQE